MRFRRARAAPPGSRPPAPGPRLVVAQRLQCPAHGRASQSRFGVEGAGAFAGAAPPHQEILARRDDARDKLEARPGDGVCQGTLPLRGQFATRLRDQVARNDGAACPTEGAGAMLDGSIAFITEHADKRRRFSGQREDRYSQPDIPDPRSPIPGHSPARSLAPRLRLPPPTIESTHCPYYGRRLGLARDSLASFTDLGGARSGPRACPIARATLRGPPRVSPHRRPSRDEPERAVPAVGRPRGTPESDGWIAETRSRRRVARHPSRAPLGIREPNQEAR